MWCSYLNNSIHGTKISPGNIFSPIIRSANPKNYVLFLVTFDKNLLKTDSDRFKIDENYLRLTLTNSKQIDYSTIPDRFPNDGDDDSIPRLSDFDGASETNRELRSNDLPPPYSECARPARRQPNKHIVTIEEPPPPYSACYVAFSNPKDGVPSVHLYNGQGQSLSDAQNPTAANGADKPDGCDASNNMSGSARTHAVVDRDVASTSNGCVANTNNHIVDMIPEEVC